MFLNIYEDTLLVVVLKRNTRTFINFISKIRFHPWLHIAFTSAIEYRDNIYGRNTAFCIPINKKIVVFPHGFVIENTK